MKNIYTIAFLLITISLIVGSVHLKDICFPKWTIYAGDYHHAGELSLTADEDGITATFNSENNWLLTEAHLYIGFDIPPPSNPDSFPYKNESLNRVSSHKMFIPYETEECDFRCGDCVVVAAHVTVTKNKEMNERDEGNNDENDNENRDEGNDNDNNERNNDNMGPTESGWIFGEYSFDKKFGWYNIWNICCNKTTPTPTNQPTPRPTQTPTTQTPTTQTPTTQTPTTQPTTQIPTQTPTIQPPGNLPSDIGFCENREKFFGVVPSLFNVFVFTNFTCHNSDTEGRIAAGGHVRISNYAVGCMLNNPSATPGSCTEWGSVTCKDLANQGQLVSTVVAGESIYARHGEIKVGNVAYTGKYDHNETIKYGAGCDEFKGNLIDFEYWQEYLKKLSLRVRDFETTGKIEFEFSTLTLIGSNNDYMEIFNIKGEQLCSTQTTAFKIENITSNATIIINVDGTDLRCGNMQLFGLSAGKTLFNFYEATDLTFYSVGWIGSVLAPLADIVNPKGIIMGQVIANSWTSNDKECMQQNWDPFEGCLDSCKWDLDSAFCTYTQEDWESDQDLLSNNFEKCFPIGIRVGCHRNSLSLTSVDAIKKFLPQTEDPTGPFTTNYVDVNSTDAGSFAGELVSLALSIELDKCKSDYASACYSFKDMIYCGNDTSCEAFLGYNVGQIWETANLLIGGCAVEAVSFEDAHKCIKFINSKFRSCESYMSNRKEFSFCSCSEENCEAKPPTVAYLERIAAEEEEKTIEDQGQDHDSSPHLIVISIIAYLLTILII